MMQPAVNLRAFARPPPRGFGFSCARQPVADLPARLRTPPPSIGIGFSCAHVAVDDVPARVRPPPPGFSRPSRVLPPSPCKIPVPPKLPKRASDNDESSTKRQRLCSDYEDDIYANLRRTEQNLEERPRPDYLKTVQKDRVTPSARARLIGWMDAFVRHHDLVDGTLHQAVAYVDRVLSTRAMNAPTDYDLRLLGAVAVFVAAKYEDGQRTVLKLDPDKIAWYGGFATRKEVLDMERHMVAALGYQLSGPTAHTFVSRFTRHAQGEDELKIQRIAHRYADESLRNYACLGYLPSLVAASAIYLARFALRRLDVRPWNAALEELTGYSALDLALCRRAMYYFSESLSCDPQC
ncbi:hypothetical protein QYE76_053325 [Lolium multiflorum]|uniref:Cyclin N-terminal domain-containing protein n=1 Tax=Lolium multiflorum TaxID=4521 RepID=A0AAD8SX03_LOLMU|nr:hypothetical protein QYE76_053325 [Lolium multiflorum]